MRAAAWLLPALLALPARAGYIPGPAGQAAFDQRVGSRLPLDAPMRAEDGSVRPLGSFLGRRPALFVPVYLRCPMLCPLALEGLVKALRVMGLQAGRDFDVIVFSFDPSDRPADAARRRAELASEARLPAGLGAFRVLTGSPDSVKRVCAALGLRAVRDPSSGEFAHAPGVVVVEPGGRTSRYFLGLEYSARDLRLALVEASAGRLGRWTDQVLLLCFHYDPNAARYTASILRTLRALGILTAAALAGGVGFALRAEGSA
jgi:protein SCO1/2